MYIDKMVQVVLSGIFSRLKMKYHLTTWWQHGITLGENKWPQGPLPPTLTEAERTIYHTSCIWKKKSCTCWCGLIIEHLGVNI